VAEERRRKEASTTTPSGRDVALFSAGANNNNNSGNAPPPSNHGSNSNNSSRHGRSNGRKGRKYCDHCRRPGHLEDDCWTKYPWKRDSTAAAAATVALIATSFLSASPIGGASTSGSNNQCRSSVWYLDCAASNPLCGDRSLFSDLASMTSRDIILGNNGVIKAIGKGMVKAVINGTPVTLNDVWYCPAIACNLLSVGKLASAGLMLTFEDNECTLQTKANKILCVVKKQENNLYPVTVTYPAMADQWEKESSESHCAAAVVSPSDTKVASMEVWHQRLNHLSLGGMLTLLRSNMVDGMKVIAAGDTRTINTCESCIVGKSHRSQMPTAATRQTTGLLQLVHSDICGPITPTSIGGSCYFITFIDDWSRYYVVYPIRNKSDAFSKFKEYKAWAELSADTRMKILRTDGGGEFISAEFLSYLKQCGIEKQTTPPHTPQHNGVAERANRVLVERMRSMLNHSGLSSYYWAEALMTAAYVRNLSPCRSVPDVTPYEKWFGRKPTVNHLRVWGCVAYCHVPKANRKKLDATAIKTVFIGYSVEAKAWKCIEPVSKKVIVSRDVTFVETDVSGGRPVGSSTDSSDTVTVSIPPSTDPSSQASVQSPAQVSVPVPLNNPYSLLDVDGDEMKSAADADEDVDVAPLNHVGQEQDQPSDHQADAHVDDVPPSRVGQEQDQQAAGCEQPVNSSTGSNRLDNTSRYPARQPQPRPDSPSRISEIIGESKSGYKVLWTKPLGAPATSTETKKKMFQKHLQLVEAWNLQQSTAQLSNQVSSGRNALAMALISGDMAMIAANVDLSVEPTSFKDAMTRSDWKEWKEACIEEMNSIRENEVWELVVLPNGVNVIGCKWILTYKYNGRGAIVRRKGRLVGKGYSQVEGLDFYEVFAPVVKFSSIRLLLALTAMNAWYLHQMDVKTAFLHGDLDVPIYMEQPEGFVEDGKEHLVCRLKKSLYGTKQAGRQWYQRMNEVLLRMSFYHLEADHCVYVFKDSSTIIILTLYVDDLLLISNSLEKMTQFKKKLSVIFHMKDLGEASYVLGLQIRRDRDSHSLSISQSLYIQKLLNRFGMANCDTVSTPLDNHVVLSKSQAPATPAAKEQMKRVPYQSAVGALMWCMIASRPDICFAVTALSQFNNCYGPTHWTAVKRVMRYLKGTQHYELTYSGRDPRSSLMCYCDSDWAGNVDDRKSITGYTFLIGGGAVSWQSRKQPTTALSSVEAEYMASTQAIKEALWWQAFVTQLAIPGVTTNSMLMNMDSQGAIALAKNPEFHARTKHIDVQHHFIREQVVKGAVKLSYVRTGVMVADIFTKALPRNRHMSLVKLVGLHAGASGSVGEV
jgi:transposase InsO family protein